MLVSLTNSDEEEERVRLFCLTLLSFSSNGPTLTLSSLLKILLFIHFPLSSMEQQQCLLQFL